MSFYRVVRDQPEEVIAQARRYTYDEGSYYLLRDRFNQRGLSGVEDASLLLYLNKTAFNGLYRVNSRGEFNVPFGRYKNPTIVPEKRIRAASKVLKEVEIFNEDFSYILDYAKKGDLCYLDPPYQPVSETANFTSYSSEKFGLDEQKRLRELCVKLDERGALFVLSNSYTEPILDLYEETKFQIKIIQAKRLISSKASTRGSIEEILVTNIPENLGCF
jgi:DNA adenine methylase